MEEAQRVRLNELRQVQDAPQVGSRRRNPRGQDAVAGLGRRDQVAHRADPADARHERRHLRERPAFAQLLEAAELGDVELRVFDAAVLAEKQRDLGVALDPADVFDSDGLFRHGYAPNLVAWLSSGLRPAMSSVSTKKMASAEGGQPCTKTSTSTTSCTGRTFASSLGI